MTLTIKLTAQNGAGVNFNSYMSSWFSDFRLGSFPYILGGSQFQGDQIVLLDELAPAPANIKLVVLDGASMEYYFAGHTLSGTLTKVRLGTLGDSYNAGGSFDMAGGHIANISTVVEMTGLSVSNARNVRGAFHNLVSALMGGGHDGGIASPALLKAAVYSEAHNVTGSALNDTHTGTKFADTVRGNGGNDIFDGQGGSDTAVFSAGRANYSIVKTAVNRVVVTDLRPGSPDGRDTLTNIEFARFGSVRISLGIKSPTVVTKMGTAGVDVLNGSGAWDRLYGLAGNDRLNGLGGNDLLNGGTGVDLMRGGTGDDLYYIDRAIDRAIELANQGTDRVLASVTYTLRANVENLTLTGSAAIHGTGNGLANVITGNGGANRLRGGGGDDTLRGGNGKDRLFGDGGNDVLDGGAGGDQMAGGDGDDTYHVGQAGDTVTEAVNQGTDTVIAAVSFTLGANVENLTLSGTASITATGNDLGNVIRGNTGDNVINGKEGIDTLAGDAGADSFVFDVALIPANADVIEDFDPAADAIHLDSAIFAALAAGALDPGSFVVDAAPADADDHLLYNSATGALSYDSDGDGAGAAIQFATLSNLAVLSAADFLVI
jgi:Ca2+-binding RTX toxin-like protein